MFEDPIGNATLSLDYEHLCHTGGGGGGGRRARVHELMRVIDYLSRAEIDEVFTICRRRRAPVARMPHV